jgi:hypothetical protein
MKLINIKDLSKMPITDEISELMFGIKVELHKVKVEIKHKVIMFKYTDFWIGHYSFYIGEDGSMGRKIINGDIPIDADIIPRTFQIVEYINNYFMSLEKYNGLKIDNPIHDELDLSKMYHHRIMCDIDIDRYGFNLKNRDGDNYEYLLKTDIGIVKLYITSFIDCISLSIYLFTDDDRFPICERFKVSSQEQFDYVVTNGRLLNIVSIMTKPMSDV